MATAARKADFVSEARQAARDLWDAQQRLLTLQAEWNGQDYTNTLDPDGFAGANAGLTTGQISSVVFDTANAIDTLMAAGHATNVTSLL